jgi:threonine 3-dehydrogenase
MLQLLASGLLNVDPIVTHEMALEEHAEGFALLERGQGGKVILTP